jgi:hypothetical protein
MTVLAKDRSALGNYNNNNSSNNNGMMVLQRLESEEMRRYRANIEDFPIIGKDSSNKRKPFLAG